MPVKTATVTWTSYRNFGTYLQAYALQKILTDSGYSNVIIDDAKIIAGFAKKRFSPLRWLRNRSWLFQRTARFRHLQQASIEEYKTFRDRYLKLDSDWQTTDDLSCRYDVYIAGSDQIWSPNVPFDDFYYLNFTDRRKVSYAPSFGTSCFPQEFVDRITPMLKSFAGLSVREPAGAVMLKDSIGLGASVVADPTLLVDTCGWDSLLGGSATDTDSEKYALCYLLTYNGAYVDYIKGYCRNKGLRLKVLVVNEQLMGIGDEEVFTGPSGFIEAVRKAEIVFTDSYHGSIFSVLYGKEFLIFRRFRPDAPDNQNLRLEFLVQKLGLDGRMTDESSLNDHWMTAPLDYTRISAAVEAFRKESMDYIKSMMEV